MNLLRALIAAILSALLAQIANAEEWSDIRNSLFSDRAIGEAQAPHFILYGPNQASNGALVPVSIHMSTAMAVHAKTLTIVVDRNPAPVAATYHFGDAFRSTEEIGDRIVATRIRIDNFSTVRAIVETSDGKLVMAAKFIAGAGGCTALPSKDLDEARANLGRMKVRQTANPERGPMWREALVMLRHPNFSGMQLDPSTGTYVPARFLRDLTVKVGDRDLVRMEGGISISEDPHLRITYASSASEPIVVTGTDTDGTTFAARSDDAGS